MWVGLPPPVVAEVARRRRLVLAAVAPDVTVLDLDDPAARAALGGELASPGSHGARYDVILSSVGLVDHPDLFAALAALSRLLGPAGALHLVEPVGRAGAAGMVISSLGATLPSAAGHHLGRDVVATVRATGLTPADIDRFTIPTMAWPWRRFVQVRAVRVPASTPTANRAAGPRVGAAT
jgi:hypothetical protein